MSWQLVKHAILMVFNNLGDAVRVSLGPFAIGLFAIGIVVMITGADSEVAALMEALSLEDEELAAEAIDGVSGQSILSIVLAALIYCLVLCWVAVAWHRFILLEEFPGFLPTLPIDRVFAYFGRAAIVLIACGIVVALGSMLVITIFGGLASGISVFLVFAIGVFAAILVYRFLLSLPSVAVGEPISLGAAWEVSRGQSGTILFMLLILAGINGVAQLALNTIILISPLLGFAFSIVIAWLSMIIGVSILTTLYGHLVEGRDLME